jgi:hypothetical protein
MSDGPAGDTKQVGGPLLVDSFLMAQPYQEALMVGQFANNLR